MPHRSASWCQGVIHEPVAGSDDLRGFHDCVLLPVQEEPVRGLWRSIAGFVGFNKAVGKRAPLPAQQGAKPGVTFGLADYGTGARLRAVTDDYDRNGHTLRPAPGCEPRDADKVSDDGHFDGAVLHGTFGTETPGVTGLPVSGIDDGFAEPLLQQHMRVMDPAAELVHAVPLDRPGRPAPGSR